MTAVGIIPARFASMRFPGKALAPIAGRPMIQHVWERACESKTLSSSLIATDDERIARVCRAFGASVRMTSPDHPTGTDRLAEACRDLSCDVVVNIQGDEPLLDPLLIDRVVETLENDPEAPMATLVHPTDTQAGENLNRVKVVLDARGRALYFSRSPIPARRKDLAGQPGARFLQHVGLYAYRRDFLRTFVNLPQTPLEQSEGLEQLRALEHGYAIAAAVVEGVQSFAVDVPEDIQAVEAQLRLRGDG